MYILKSTDPLQNNPNTPPIPPEKKPIIPDNISKNILPKNPSLSESPSLTGRTSIEQPSKTSNSTNDYVLSSLKIREPSISHHQLIDLLVALYPEKASTGGICHGFALMGMPAVFLRDIDKFNDRLERLRLRVDSAVQGGKTYKQLIEDLEKNKEYDLLPFLEGVQICMHGDKYPELVDPEVGRIRVQNAKNFVKTFLSLVASKELEEKGEVVQINQERSGIYTQDSLSSYFKNLRGALLAPPRIQESINILFGSTRAPHAITVGYDPKEDLYLFIDSNHGYITKVKNEEEIADAVMKGYSDSFLPDGSVALSHTIYAINCYEEEKKEIEALIQDKNIDLAILKIKELPSSKDQLHFFLKIIPLDLGASWDSFIQKESISRCKSMKATCSLAMVKEQDPSLKKLLQLIIDSLEDRIINAKDVDKQKEYKSSGIKSLEEKESLLESKLAQTVPIFSSEQQKDWLLLASYQNDLASVQKLIEANVDLNVKDSAAFAPLLISIHSGHTEIALALIKAGADLNVKDSKGNTPLHTATILGRTEIALALIKAGADLNIQDLSGDTPLHLATILGRTEIALALINHPDIDLEIKDLKGHTFRDFAMALNLKEIMDAIDVRNLIIKKEEDYKSALTRSAQIFLEFEEDQDLFHATIDFLFEKHSTGSLLYNLSVDYKKNLIDSLQGLSFTEKEEKLKTFIDSLAPSKEQIALNLTNSIKFQPLLKAKIALQNLSDQLLTAMKDKSTSPEKQLDLVTARNKASKAFVEQFNSIMGLNALSVKDLKLSNPILLESNINKAMNILIDSGFRI